MSHYRQERLIGSGGMASVYEGFDEQLERPVAIKVPSEAVTNDPELLALFLAEARKMARVSHQNVVAIHAIEEDGGRPRMIMELVGGGSLLTALEGGPTPAGSVATILEQCLRGLQAIHRQGIVHRDVKPENILRQDDHPDVLYKIGDFGIAKLADERTAPFRTDKYAAPECLRGEPALFASDLYSLGLVAYELLLGTDGYHRTVERSLRGTFYLDVPWQDGQSSAEWHFWHRQSAELPPPHEVDPTIPEPLSLAVWRMVRKRIEDRAPDCTAALAGLGAAAAPEVEAADAGTVSGRIEAPDPEGSRDPTAAEPDRPSTAGPRHPRPTLAEAPVARRPSDAPPALRRSSGGGRWTVWTGAALLAVSASLVFVRFQERPPPLAGQEADAADLRERGLAAWAAKDYRSAIEDLERVLREDPRDEAAALALAKANYQIADYERARSLLLPLVETRPDDPERALYLGLTELSRGAPGDAAEHLGRTVEAAAGRYPEARFFLGFAYFKEGAWDEAEVQFEEFLKAGSGKRELESRARAFLDGLERRRAAPGDAAPAERLGYGTRQLHLH